jgi:hypothetical protein
MDNNTYKNHLLECCKYHIHESTDITNLEFASYIKDCDELKASKAIKESVLKKLEIVLNEKLDLLQKLPDYNYIPDITTTKNSNLDNITLNVYGHYSNHSEIYLVDSNGDQISINQYIDIHDKINKQIS